MKILILSVSAVLSLSVMADEIQATCTPRPFTKSNSEILEDVKSIKITFDKETISFGEKGNEMKGTFMKVVKDNGSWQYDSQDVADLADQTDYGRVFVSKSLTKGKDGVISLSYHQLGDSEGAWWNTESFNCEVQ